MLSSNREAHNRLCRQLIHQNGRLVDVEDAPELETEATPSHPDQFDVETFQAELDLSVESVKRMLDGMVDGWLQANLASGGGPPSFSPSGAGMLHEARPPR